MKSPFFAFLFAMLLPIAGALAADDQRITEPQIHKVFDAFSRAAKAKSIRGFADYMAADIKITEGDPDTKEERIMFGSRDAFLADLEPTYAAVEAYTLETGPLQITIAADGQTATVTHSQTEHWAIQGEKSTKTTFQSYKFAIQQGRLLIQSVSIWARQPK